MFSKSRYYLSLLIIFITKINFFSQLPQSEEKLVRITKEVWVGVTAHTGGIGLNFNVAKFKTYKIKTLLNVELLNIKDNKEYKIYGAPDENAKKYVYGKLNSLYVFRSGIGRRKVVLEKLREKGLQLAVNWSSGFTLGLVKPVYLEVLKFDVLDNLTGISSERYDPDIHQFSDIYGRARWSSGLFQTKFNPGAYFKIGLEFDYSLIREVINTLEIGFVLDLFYNPVKIMAENNANYTFPNLYLNFSLGNKFY